MDIINKKSKRRIFLYVLILCVFLGFQPDRALALDTKTAAVSTDSLYINSNLVAVAAYKIDGSNYYRLRDLAAVLSDSEKKFNIGWDNSKEAISLNSGESYTPIGGDLAPLTSSTSETASLTNDSLYIDGVLVLFNAYKIDGNNYFKLRDILRIFNTDVEWNDALQSIAVDTSKPYIYVAGDGVEDLVGSTLPKLTVTGTWPCSKQLLQTAWAKYFPLMVKYFGLPSDIVTNGIVWDMNTEKTSPDQNSYYPENNTISLGNLWPADTEGRFHYPYERLVRQYIHETGHLWLQTDDGKTNLTLGFGQWIWEAATNVVAEMLDADYYDYGDSALASDLINYLGDDSLNGTHNDGLKFNRNNVDSSGVWALFIISTVCDKDGSCDFFTKVNKQRVEYYHKTGDSELSAEEFGEILDKVADGRTIDGLKPSAWLFSRSVADIDGPEGTYLYIIPSLEDTLTVTGGNQAGHDLRVSIGVYKRTTRSDGLKAETALVGQNVKVDMYAANGTLLGRATATANNSGYIDKLEIPGSDLKENSAVRYVATMTVDGATYEDVNYSLYLKDAIRTDDDRMFFILTDKNENIVDDLTKKDLSVTGAESVDYSALANGLLIITAKQGDDVTVTLGGYTRTVSKPLGSRIIPLTVR